MHGVCISRKPWLLVTEYMKFKDLGGVMSRLKRHAVTLRINEFFHPLVQIAASMRYLDERRILHRDLALRNVLLGEGNVVKLGDFGQARYLQGNDTTWKLDRESRLPIRYLGNESLTKKIFSAKSDVWAFGITMWEILTYAT